MNKKDSFLFGFTVLLMAVIFTMAGCGDADGGPTGHTHTPSAEWSYDVTQHWHNCTADDGTKLDIANHTDDPCEVCGYDIIPISLTITEIDEMANGRTVRIVIVSDPMQIRDALEEGADPLAYGEGTISSGSVTVSLKTPDGESDFGVSGSYYVGFYLDSWRLSFFYTNGATLEDLGMESVNDFNELPKLFLPATGLVILQNKFLGF